MFYQLIGDDLPTLAVADDYKTMLSLIVADTAGHRARLRTLTVGFADDSPADNNVGLTIERIADVGGGSPGTLTAVAVGDIAKVDPGSIDSIVSGGRNYTVEPAAFETEPLWTMGLNDRGGLEKEWTVEEAAKFIVLQDQLLALRSCPRVAVLSRMNVTLGFEVF